MIPVTGGTIAGVVAAFILFGIVLSGPPIVIMFVIRGRARRLFRDSPIVTWNPWGVIALAVAVTLMMLVPTNAPARIEYEDTWNALLSVWGLTILCLVVCLLVPWRAIFTDEPWLR